MNITTTSLEGILIIKPRVFKDARGFFMETYNRNRYTGAGVDIAFVQDNLSYSLQGTVRGLHFQRTDRLAHGARLVFLDAEPPVQCGKIAVRGRFDDGEQDGGGHYGIIFIY